MVILFTTVTLHAYKENNKTHVMMVEGVYDFSTSNENFLAKWLLLMMSPSFFRTVALLFLASAISFYLIRIFVPFFSVVERIMNILCAIH